MTTKRSLTEMRERLSTPVPGYTPPGATLTRVVEPSASAGAEVPASSAKVTPAGPTRLSPSVVAPVLIAIDRLPRTVR